MLLESNKNKGRFGLAMAIAYFTSKGYTISTPLNDTQWYDLIIEKDGKFETIQCKCTGSQNNAVMLKSCGGTNGSTYDSVLNHSGLDYLFCVDVSGNMFVIPMSEIRASGNTKQITLRTEPTANNQGFQTHKFRVQFSFQAP
jgi:hypothetical protein